MEVLDAMNWARGVVGVGASFCGRGLFRDGPDQGMWRLVDVRRKKMQKKGESLNRP